jgi:hypothetical protein
MNRKSQIQMGETIAIIVIVMFILIIGLGFWKSTQTKDIEIKARDSEDLSIIVLSKTVPELPEFKCYSTESVSKVNCIDYYKIMAFNLSMNTPLSRQKTFDYYRNYFHRSKITFAQLYPSEFNITVYDNNITSTKSLKISIPIVIEKSLGRKGVKGFGLLIVEGYFK